jgi:hypothetical protein
MGKGRCHCRRPAIAGRQAALTIGPNQGALSPRIDHAARAERGRGSEAASARRPPQLP